MKNKRKRSLNPKEPYRVQKRTAVSISSQDLTVSGQKQAALCKSWQKHHLRAWRHLGWTLTAKTCIILRWLSIPDLFLLFFDRSQLTRPASMMVQSWIIVFGKSYFHFCDGEAYSLRGHCKATYCTHYKDNCGRRRDEGSGHSTVVKALLSKPFQNAL